ncbi:MAG: OB-fold-containig protein [Puniceicoccaceae bacterium]
MFSHYIAPENLPFAIALGLFFLIGAVQMLSLLTGVSLFGWIDDLLPDFEGADFDLPEAGADGWGGADTGPGGADSHGWPLEVFAWLNFGRVPFIISFLLLLFLFAFFGYNLQLVLARSGAGLLPAVVAAPAAFALSILPLKWGNRLLGHVLPGDETSAVSRHSFVGRVATITIGEATHERSAEAKLKGPLGRTHYIMVRADREDRRFPQGESVLIVGKEDGCFTCIEVNNPHLGAARTTGPG